MCATKIERTKWAKETVEIVDQGYYVNCEGQKVVLNLDYCSEPVLYTPELLRNLVEGQHFQNDSASSQGCGVAVVRVTGDSSLGACHLLSTRSSASSTPCCLNFASAKNPGGGFASGARAQEESLARSSALYYSLTRPRVQEYYVQNRKTKDGFYTDHIIYSPHVPIIRDHASGHLLPAPQYANFITVPAVNYGVVKKRSPGLTSNAVTETVNTVMKRRGDYLLAVAAANDQKDLVLGAWGCGVFQNDPSNVANIFKNLLIHKYSSVFDTVTFAILAKNEQDRTLKAFKQVFCE